MFYRCIEEILVYLRSTNDPRGNAEGVVLYGAGGRCQLFLRELGFNDTLSFDGRNIVGLIDDEPSLHFNWVHGQMVLGGLPDLPQLIPRHHITGIVITATLTPEARAAVQAMARQHHLRLSEWCLENRNLILSET